MPNPIKDELVGTQAWILDAGFRIVRYNYSYKAMGSSDVELQSEAFRMHWVRDRGTWVFAEVGPHGEQLWGLTAVIEAVTGSRPEYDPTKLEVLASLFRENLDLVKKALGPDWPQTKAELERRTQGRLKAAMTPRPISREAKRTLRQLRLRRWLRFVTRPAFLVLVLLIAFIVSVLLPH